jgi:hypothetical protein
MVTQRCRFCGEVYVPNKGAIRSYYCSRSCRDKYNRHKKRSALWSQCASPLLLNSGMGQELIDHARNPNGALRQLSLLLGLVEPKYQREAIHYVRRILDNYQAYGGVR